MLTGLQSVEKGTKLWQSTGNSGLGQKRGSTKRGHSLVLPSELEDPENLR